jgi:hypothetical protein
MSNYTPDLWEILELKFNDSEEITRKIMASWYGGYLDGDSWRLSSGITEIIDKETYYEIHNESGSVYHCNKNSRGMSGYTTGVFDRLITEIENRGSVKIVNDL